MAQEIQSAPRLEQKLGQPLVWAKIFVETSERSALVIKLLKEAGYLVSTIPVDSLYDPVAFINGRLYRGVEAIQRFINGEPYRGMDYDY